MSTERPNILWYCTDQQRFDTIGELGNPHVDTPTLDGLVRAGVAFTRAYCQSPICTPSRSSFLTGMYPARLHNTRNGNESFPSTPSVITRLLADAGYDCGLVGKYHLQSAAHRSEPRIDDGYRYWRFSHAPRDDWPQGHDYADWVKASGGDLDAMRNSKDHVDPELHQTKWLSDMAIDFIKQEHDGRPWLLSLNPYDPHPPFIPPRSYAERFTPELMPGPHFRESDLQHQAKLSAVDFQGDIRTPEGHDAFRQQALYYAMIKQIDDQFARVLQGLEETGQRENTVIIFTSDHGEMLGDHGLMFKGCRFYEGLVRVPLIFSWPKKFKSGLQCSGLVELLDMTATITELCDVPRPDYMQGRSLLPILTGEMDPNRFRKSVRCEYFDSLDERSGSFATMHCTERYKLSIYHGLGLGELYDLENDPWEFVDLWDHPDYQKLKNELIYASFEEHVLLTTDVGSRRIAPM